MEEGKHTNFQITISNSKVKRKKQMGTGVWYGMGWEFAKLSFLDSSDGL